MYFLVYALILVVVARISIVLARRARLSMLVTIPISAAVGGILFWGMLFVQGYAEGNLTPPVLCCFELAAILVAGIFGVAFRRRPVLPGHCVSCNYDLYGNESGRCPECGTLINEHRNNKYWADLPSLSEIAVNYPAIRVSADAMFDVLRTNESNEVLDAAVRHFLSVSLEELDRDGLLDETLRDELYWMVYLFVEHEGEDDWTISDDTRWAFDRLVSGDPGNVILARFDRKPNKRRE